MNVSTFIQTVQINTCLYSFLFMVTWFAVFMILFKLTSIYKEGSSQALLMLCNRTVGIRLHMGLCLCNTYCPVQLSQMSILFLMCVEKVHCDVISVWSTLPSSFWKYFETSQHLEEFLSFLFQVIYLTVHVNKHSRACRHWGVTSEGTYYPSPLSGHRFESHVRFLGSTQWWLSSSVIDPTKL